MNISRSSKGWGDEDGNKKEEGNEQGKKMRMRLWDNRMNESMLRCKDVKRVEIEMVFKP